MTDAPASRWPAAHPEANISAEQAALVEILELRDRVIGLEQQLNEVVASQSADPSARVLAERELAQLKASVAFRVGRLVTLPVRVARVIVRRVLR